MNIKPIETLYKGYRFRSRLEARWAVFFDHLGLEWEYEPEGFELITGRYLPDFLLNPGRRDLTYVEVKPYKGADTSKSMQFARESGHDIIICYGLPSTNTHPMYQREGWVCDSLITPGKYAPVYKNVGAVPGDPMPIWWTEAGEIITAMLAAKQARFGV